MASVWKPAGLGYGVLCQSLNWPFEEVEVVFSVFESSSIEAMTWTSEGCDFTRAKTLLALWPHPSKTQGRKAEVPWSLVAGLAGRAQARGPSSESGTCPIYLRVGWCKAKAWLCLWFIALSSSPYLTIRSWRYRGCYPKLGVGQLLASSQAPFPSRVWS